MQALIFDLDGVLLESTAVKTQAFRELFADYPNHLAAIVSYHEAHAGISRFEKFRYIFSSILRQPLSDEKIDSLGTRYAELTLAKVLDASMVNGAEAFLETYYRDIPLFVASGTPSAELQHILAARCMNHYFRGAFGSPAHKAEIVERILVDWSLPGTEVALVGDSATDLQAAESNGVRFIGRVHAESPPAWLTQAKFATVKDLVDLRAMLSSALRPA